MLVHFFSAGLIIYDNGNNEGGLTSGSSYITLTKTTSGVEIPACDVSEYKTLNITFTPTVLNNDYINFRLGYYKTGTGTTYLNNEFSGTLNTKQTFSIDISNLSISSTADMSLYIRSARYLLSISNTYSTISGYIYKIWFE